MVNIKYFLLISSVILFVFAFYRWLTRYLRRKDITIPFTYLFPFKKGSLAGREEIRFDLPIAATVRGEILKENGELVSVIFEEKYKAGIHSKEIDLSLIADGVYNLKVVLPDQTITRFIEIKN